MGMRFKKSKKIAPGVKLNVSNKSVGVSVGGKGVHHSVSSSGRKTTTVSAPGTGLSYVKTSGGGSRKRKSSKKAQSGTVGCGTILLGFILFFLIVGVFSSGFSSGRKKAAEAAASQYVENVQRLQTEKEAKFWQMEIEAKERAENIIEEAQAYSRRVHSETDKYQTLLAEKLKAMLTEYESRDVPPVTNE